jgi:hypothetical protein
LRIRNEKTDVLLELEPNDEDESKGDSGSTSPTDEDLSDNIDDRWEYTNTYGKAVLATRVRQYPRKQFVNQFSGKFDASKLIPESKDAKVVAKANILKKVAKMYIDYNMQLRQRKPESGGCSSLKDEDSCCSHAEGNPSSTSYGIDCAPPAKPQIGFPRLTSGPVSTCEPLCSSGDWGNEPCRDDGVKKPPTFANCVVCKTPFYYGYDYSSDFTVQESELQDAKSCAALCADNRERPSYFLFKSSGSADMQGPGSLGENAGTCFCKSELKEPVRLKQADMHIIVGEACRYGADKVSLTKEPEKIKKTDDAGFAALPTGHHFEEEIIRFEKFRFGQHAYEPVTALGVADSIGMGQQTAKLKAVTRDPVDYYQFGKNSTKILSRKRKLCYAVFTQTQLGGDVSGPGFSYEEAVMLMHPELVPIIRAERERNKDESLEPGHGVLHNGWTIDPIGGVILMQNLLPAARISKECIQNGLVACDQDQETYIKSVRETRDKDDETFIDIIAVDMQMPGEKQLQLDKKI